MGGSSGWFGKGSIVFMQIANILYIPCILNTCNWAFRDTYLYPYVSLFFDIAKITTIDLQYYSQNYKKKLSQPLVRQLKAKKAEVDCKIFLNYFNEQFVQFSDAGYSNMIPRG